MILIIGLFLIYLNFLLYYNISFPKLFTLIILLYIYSSHLISLPLPLLDGVIQNNEINNQNTSILLILFIIFLYLNNLKIKKEKLIIIYSNLIGLIFLINSYDFQMIFLNLELINLSLYLLIGNYSSGLKYFLLSSLLSTFFLLGVTLLYSTYGHQNIEILLSQNNYKYSTFGYLLILLTFFFKLGLFPFHQWSPDLYSGISYIFLIYIQIFIKFGLLILLYNLNLLFLPLFSYTLFFGLSTLVIASILLPSQFNIQRFIALSSIAHLGFLILQYSYSYLFYLYIYSFTSLILYFLFSYKYSNLIIKIFLTLLLLSLSGLPPLPGFFSKLYILIDQINLGYLSIIILIFLSSIILSANYIYLGLISFLFPAQKKISSKENQNFLAIFMTLFLFFIFF